MSERFNSDELGLLVQKLRREQQLSQADLAERAGLSQGQISQIERGQGNPTVSNLDLIAKALGIATFVLLGGFLAYHLYQAMKEINNPSG
jgi:transcriptional regulator with XRE-family HTH domain